MLTIWHTIVPQDPNVEDDFGMTALHCSAKKGDRKAASLLTSQSTCLHKVKMTLLFSKSHCNICSILARLCLQIVALLLAHGARVSSCAENWKGCS